MPFIEVQTKRFPEPLSINTNNILWLHSFETNFGKANNMPPLTRVYMVNNEYVDIEGSKQQVAEKLNITIHGI